MSYFMTISGPASDMPLIVGIELLPAEDAPDYIKSLVNELETLDGRPVHFVHDCETGTSDVVIAELENALLDEEDVSELLAANILKACFDRGLSFRIWWASRDQHAHTTNASQVSNLTEAYAAIKAGHGASWRGE